MAESVPGSAATTMASMTDDPFTRSAPADYGMEDVLWCYRRTLLQVAWSRAEEPHCEHSGPPLMRNYQPASKCRICKDRPKLAEWRDYWTKIKAEAARIRAERSEDV